MKHFFFLALAIAGERLLAQTVIPNAGFENWTAVGTYSLPDSWGTMNNSTASFSVYTATKGTPGSPGTGYLKLTSKTTGSTVTGGIAVSGKLDTLTLQPKSGFAYNLRPANFAGKWQYMVYGNSIGSIRVLTTKWNATAMKRDTIAHAETNLTGMAMSWANFSIPLTYLDSLRYPDSCMIVLKASGANPSNNDYLWVDNLAFTGTVAVYTPTVDTTGLPQLSTSITQVQVWPVPARDNLQLNIASNLATEAKLQVFALTGQLLQTQHINLQNGSTLCTLNVSNYARGTYILQISSNNNTLSKQLIIE